MDQELVQYLDERFAGVDLRFEEIRRQFEEMRGEMHEGFDEVKRHSGTLIEDLRYKVQLVAEEFATFVEGRYAQDQARVDERFRETHALIRSSYNHLNQRVENIERKDQS
jgi:hypothetical protein